VASRKQETGPDEPLVSAQPPKEATAPLAKPISKFAGGAKAALVATKFAWSEMGVVRGTRT